jgi:YHS domain-containing protein
MKKKYLASHFICPCGLLLAFLLGSFHAVAANDDPLQQLVKTNPATKSLKFSATFQGRGDGVATCPVTGEKVTTKSLKAEYFGRTVYFCCHGCLKAAQRSPEKFIKPTLAEQQSAVRTYVAKVAQAPDGAEFCDE